MWWDESMVTRWRLIKESQENKKIANANFDKEKVYHK